MIQFEYPLMYLCVFLPWLVYRFGPSYASQRSAIWAPFFSDFVRISGEAALSSAVVIQRQRWQKIMIGSVWLLLLTALAKPVWLGEPIEIKKPARDLMVAVDLSGSMAEQDFASQGAEPLSRLRGAKQVLSDFADQRQGDRLGLMVFGDAPYLQLPFSDDHDLFVQLLEQSHVRMAGPKTMLGDAIGYAYRHFLEDAEKQSSSDSDRSRVLILVSDGNDSGSRIPPIEATELAASAGIKIYPILLGRQDAVGEQAIDEEQLHNIAQISGGRFFRAQNKNALEKISATLDALEPSRFAISYFRPSQPLYYWPLLLALIIAQSSHFYFALLTAWRLRRSSEEVK